MAAIRRDSMQPGSAEFCLSNSAVLPLEKPQSCKSGKLCGTLRHEPSAPPSLGHIARIYGAVDVERVLPLLEKALADGDPAIAAEAETAPDDLRLFDPAFRARPDQLHRVP